MLLSDVNRTYGAPNIDKAPKSPVYLQYKGYDEIYRGWTKKSSPSIEIRFFIQTHTKVIENVETNLF